MITELEILNRLKDLAVKKREVEVALAKIRRSVTEVESNLISIKLEFDRTKEALRVHRATIPSLEPEITQRDQEIERFRETHPDECALARERDLGKT